MKSDKRIYIFAGGLGCGKTEIAVNFSLNWAKSSTSPIYLVDLDIIKPYFRSREVKDRFRSFKLKVISPPEPVFFSDLPALSPQIDTHLKNISDRVVIDLGGGKEGSRILGRYRKVICDSLYEIYYVINTKRPFNRSLKEILNQIEEIEYSSGMKITGLIHNTHLLWETNLDMVYNALPIVEEVSAITGIKLKFHCLSKDIFKKHKEELEFKEEVFPLKCFLWPEWVR